MGSGLTTAPGIGGLTSSHTFMVPSAEPVRMLFCERGRPRRTASRCAVRCWLAVGMALLGRLVPSSSRNARPAPPRGARRGAPGQSSVHVSGPFYPLNSG